MVIGPPSFSQIVATEYHPPTQDMIDVCNEAIKKWHRELLEADARIQLCCAVASLDKNGDKTGPALKEGRVPCLALTKIQSHKNRALGLGDAVIYIDGDAWLVQSPAERLALLDHELTHIELIEDADEGGWQLDAGGRPKMKSRPHDRTFGWFDEVAKRHGNHSHEVRQAAEFVAETGQLYFPGLAPILRAV